MQYSPQNAQAPTAAQLTPVVNSTVIVVGGRRRRTVLGKAADRKRILETYRKASAALREEPLSYRHFYCSLSYLQSLGLVVLVSTKVNRTYTNRIQLTFDPGILTTVLQMRFA